MIDFRLEDAALGPVLRLHGDLTIENGDRLKTILVESIESRDRLYFDLSAVTRVDAAGFQLLWSAFQTAGHSGRGGALESLPEDLKQELLGAGYALGEGNVHRIHADTAFEKEGR